MECIHVSASSEYDVLIGHGLMQRSGELIKKTLGTQKMLVVCGENVSKLYLSGVLTSLRRAGLEALSLVIQSGESAKSPETLQTILSFLAQNCFGRDDAILALGGGVTGDVSGFAAAIYQRGMGLVQMPTTLLAAVDSSVGGKTAINIAEGKNLVGCFYQPQLVICDIDAFSTLPESIYRDGFAEIIKYAMILSPELFELLQDFDSLDVEDIVARCVILKRDIVASDEQDFGPRHILNFGHSIGHAIEKCSDYAISHGSAVSIGMAMISRAASRFGLCSADTVNTLTALLNRYSLPVETSFTADELYASMLSDKKRSGDALTLVVPSGIGNVELRKTPYNELMEWLKAGGSR